MNRTLNPIISLAILLLTENTAFGLQPQAANITIEPRVIMRPDQTMLITIELTNPYINEDVIWIGYISTGLRTAQGQLQTVVINVPMGRGQPPVTLGPYIYSYGFESFRLRPHVVALLFLDDDRWDNQQPNPTPPWQWQTALGQAQGITNQILNLRSQHEITRAQIDMNEISLSTATEEGDLAAADGYGSQNETLETNDSTTLTSIDNAETTFGQGLIAIGLGGQDGAIVRLELTGYHLSADEDFDYAEVEDEVEESVGGLILLNSDDDNGNDITDLYEGENSVENDLLPTWWFYGRPVANLMNEPNWGSLTIRTGNTSVLRLWGSMSKSSTPSLTIGGPASCNRVYVEGQQVQSDIVEAIIQSGPASGQDRVTLRGVAISLVRWQDTDIIPTRLFEGGNFITNPPNGDRWHPDRLQPGANPGVFLRLRATVEGVDRLMPVYAKSYDVDDPSIDEAALLINSDLDTGIDDNWGLREQRNEGFLRNSQNADRIATAWVSSGGVVERTAYYEFEPTHCPGDNFRIAVSLNRKDLIATADKYISTPTAWAPIHDPTAQAWMHAVSGGVNARSALATNDDPAPLKQSPLLTVWRFLHVEEDMALNPTGAQNRVEGQITDVWMHPTIAGASVLQLDCPLDDTDQYGQYFFGTPFPQGLLSVFDSELNIWRDFDPIANTMGNASNPAQVAVINDIYGLPPTTGEFILIDDDGDSESRLPVTPVIEYCRTVYRSVYVEVVVDGGGNSANNVTNLAFERAYFEFPGSGPTAASAMTRSGALQSDGNRDPYYWIAYVQSTWQDGFTEDLDPDVSNSWIWGRTSIAGGGSLIYSETCRDVTALYGWNELQSYNDWAHTVCHEIGHQFHILDHDSTNTTIMGINSQAPNVMRFLPRHAKEIRNQAAVENKIVAMP